MSFVLYELPLLATEAADAQRALQAQWRRMRRGTGSGVHFRPFTWSSSSLKLGRSVEYRTLRPNSIATWGA